MAHLIGIPVPDVRHRSWCDPAWCHVDSEVVYHVGRISTVHLSGTTVHGGLTASDSITGGQFGDTTVELELDGPDRDDHLLVTVTVADLGRFQEFLGHVAGLARLTEAFEAAT